MVHYLYFDNAILSGEKSKVLLQCLILYSVWKCIVIIVIITFKSLFPLTAKLNYICIIHKNLSGKVFRQLALLVQYTPFAIAIVFCWNYISNWKLQIFSFRCLRKKILMILEPSPTIFWPKILSVLAIFIYFIRTHPNNNSIRLFRNLFLQYIT